MSDTHPLRLFRSFEAAGPVSARFVADRTSRVKMLLGPVGGGKTVACVRDSVTAATLMPQCNDGIIRYRRAIIGTTYGQLERNLYRTWHAWLEPGDSWTEQEWIGGGGRFATHKLSFDIVRNHRLVTVQAEYIFAAIGEIAVEQFMRGFEPTDIWMFEADQLPQAVLSVGLTRIGRYPQIGNTATAVPRKTGYHRYVCGDLNAPDTDSWFYQVFEETRPEGFALYKQPSGTSAQAENRQHQHPSYYDDQIASLSAQPGGRHLVARMVHAQYAPSRAGDPVYEEYSDDLHLAPVELLPAPRAPIVLGFDQGLGQPACVGFQVLPNGQRRVLFEVLPGRMNARRFAEQVRLELEAVAPEHPLAETHYADPAGFDGADKEDGDLAWAEIVGLELGIVVLPTDTNEIGVRHGAVVDQLLHPVGPGEFGLLISRRCRHLRKGFVSHYMFDKRPAEKSQTRKPVKNFWANIHDALQYGLLGIVGRSGVIAGPRAGRGSRTHANAGGDCVVVQAPMVV